MGIAATADPWLQSLLYLKKSRLLEVCFFGGINRNEMEVEKMLLNAISKKIIVSRLYDKGIKINESDLDNYLISMDNFPDYNSMYDFIVNNYNKLIIG